MSQTSGPSPSPPPTADGRDADRAGPFLRWWDRQRSAVRIPVSILGAVLFYTAFRLLAGVWDEGSSGWWIFLVVALVVSGAVIGVSLVLARRRLGGREQPRLLRQAFRSGEIPDGADRAAWVHELGRRRRQLGETAWTVWVMGAAGALFVLLTVVVAVVVVVSGGPPAAVVVLGALVVVQALLFWGVLRLRRWQVARHDRVLAALEGPGRRLDPAATPE